MKNLLCFIILVLLLSSNLIRSQNAVPIPYKSDKVWRYSDTSGIIVINDVYGKAEPFHDGVAKVLTLTDDGMRYGYINTEGKLITSIPADCSFCFLEDHNEGIVSSKIAFDPAQYFNSKGEKFFESKYFVGKFNKGLAPAQLSSDEWAYIDTKGNKVIKFPKGTVHELKNFHGEFAEVYLEKLLPGFREESPGKVTMVDRKGKFPIKKTFAGMSYSADGIFQCSGMDYSAFFSKAGKLLFKYEAYTRINDFHRSKAKIRIDRKYGFVNKSAKVIIPAEYEEAYDFLEEVTFVKSNGEWRLIDENNKPVNSEVYYNTKGEFSEGLAAVYNKGWFFIDKSGKRICSQNFEDVGNFQEGLANVKLNNKWGFIDKSGQFVINNKYSRADSFSNGIVKVYIDAPETWFYIDKNGKEYWDGPVKQSERESESSTSEGI